MASDQARKLLADLLAARSGDAAPPEASGDLVAERAGWEASVAEANAALGGGHEELLLGGVAVERVGGSGPLAGPVIVHLHGGGFALGSSVTHRELAQRIALSAGCDVIVPNYRLAPEDPFPAGLDDCCAVVDALVETGVDPATVVLGGDSAGAALALGVLMDRRQRERVELAGAYLLSPSIDLTVSGATIVTHAERDPLCSGADLARFSALYRGDVAADHPVASPLHGDLAALPPLLVHAGSEEVHLSDAIRLAGRAASAGVDVTLHVWDGLWHVFHSWADLPEATEAVAEVAAFVRRVAARPASGRRSDPARA